MNRRLLASLLLACALVPTPRAAVEDESQGPLFLKSSREWRKNRLETLRSESGWLTLVGLHWLAPGENAFGSDPSNPVVLPAGKAPSRAGVFVLEGDRVRVRVAKGSGITLDGHPVGEREIRTDASGDPDVLKLGTLSFFVIRRADRYAVRVKDSRSPVRLGFQGIECFPPDAAWRIVARFVPYDPPKEVEIASVLGTTEKQSCPGYVVFRAGGKELTLEPIVESSPYPQLFFIFKDETSGKETYEAGRFLYADPPSSGKVVLDFNRAFNPPCAFTRYATCPLPPKQNWLPIRVEAGEKTYVAKDPTTTAR